MKGNEENRCLGIELLIGSSPALLIGDMEWFHPRQKKHCIFTSDGTLRESPKARHDNLPNRGKLPK
jgi:hypothetical protein